MLRPQMHLAAAGKLYPNAWRQAEKFRADRGRAGLSAWPSWCYLPMAAWYAIVSEGKGPLGLELVGDVGRLAAVGTWRVTQGVYRFDQDLYEAVRSTPLEGDLPAAILYRLPEWCVYIETTGMQGGRLHGFFAHLEWDANTGRRDRASFRLPGRGCGKSERALGPHYGGDTRRRLKSRMRQEIAPVPARTSGGPTGTPTA
jgi:hypothetical protein